MTTRRTAEYLLAILASSQTSSAELSPPGTPGEIRILCLRALLVGYLLLLWLDQVLYVPMEKDSVRVSDLALLVICVALLGLFWRTLLKVLRAPPALACLAFFASLVVSTVVHEGGALARQELAILRPFLRLALQFALLLVFAVAAISDSRWFGRFLTAFASLVVLVAAGGALLALALHCAEVQWAPRLPAFFVQDQHPLFGNWPRPVGGFSRAAEKFGFWAMLASAVLVASAIAQSNLRRVLLVVLSALVAIATLTISASGGLLFLPILLHHRGYRRASRWAVMVIVALLLAAQLPVHLAETPAGVKPGVSRFDCTEHYQDHLARSQSPDGSSCRLLPGTQGKVLTRYGLAKQHAWAVWRRSPLLGEGAASFKREARAAVDDSGEPIVWAYRSPHSALAGTAAGQGLLGLGLLLSFVVLLLFAMRAAELPGMQGLAVTLALAGFAAASFSQDATNERLFWIVCGYALGLALGSATARQAQED